MREGTGVYEAVAASMHFLGVAPEIWRAIDNLTTEEKVHRIRSALAELQHVQADGVAIRKDVVQSLLACCWSVTVNDTLKSQLRQVLLELSHLTDAEVAMNRKRLIELPRVTLQSYQ